MFSVRSIVVTLVVGWAVSAGAQSVTVQVSSRSISDDDEVQATFSFEGSGDPQLPSLTDWNIVGQSRQIRTSVVMGRPPVETNIHQLVLRPKREGRLTIGAATMVAGGRVVARSEPIEIIVRGVQPLKPSEIRQNLPRDALLLLPEITRDEYFVGEPFVVEYVLLVRRGSGLRGLEASELVSPDGVQREDVLQGRYEQEDEPMRLFGADYVRVPVFREVWRVLRPDVIKIPSFNVTVQLPSRSMFNVNQQRLKAPPIELVINGVPEDGRPKGYREGAVGQFSIQGEIKPDQAGQRAILEVRISGRGSLPTVDRPAVDGVTGAQVQPLPSDDMDVINTDATGIHGRRVFQYLLKPTRAGTVFVPPISFVYFDPQTRRFETIKTQQLTYQAKLAEPTGRSVGPAVGADGRASLHPIEGETTLETVSRTPMHQRAWFLALVFVPLALFLGVELRVFIARRRQSQSGRVRQRRAHTHAKRRLKDAESQMREGKAEQFFGTIAKTLRTYVLERHGVALTGMTNDQMRGALRGVGVPDDPIERLIAELENCDFARFAPGAGGETQMKEALTRADQLLSDMEKAA